MIFFKFKVSISFYYSRGCAEIVSVRNCDNLWAHFPSPASRVNEYRATEEWRRGKQRDWRKSCPLVTLSTQSPIRISLWLESDLGPDILLP